MYERETDGRREVAITDIEARFTRSFSYFPFFLPFYFKRRIHALP